MFNLPKEDARYLAALYRQFKSKAARPLLRIGQNFFPSALLSGSDRENCLGAVQYESLLSKKTRYEKAAKSITLTLNPMNGGIGTSLKRESYLKGVWRSLKRKGKPNLGAKGSDLFFQVQIEGKKKLVSISEAKLIRAFRQTDHYASIVIEHLVSSETKKSVEELLGSARKNLRNNPRLKIVKPLVQGALPTIDASGKISRKRLAPGGHGHWGVHFLRKALEKSSSKKTVDIHAIYNEDGINNTVDAVISGWMAEEHIPIAMITTTKTNMDQKGGLLGMSRQGWGKSRKEIMEEAQASQAGQRDMFQEMGLTQGEPGGQYFNTNTALINFTVLGPILKDLAKTVGQDKFAEIISPALILNVKVQKEGKTAARYIQLEGALGACLLELDGFLQTSDDPKVRAVLKRHGLLRDSGRVQFLKAVNVSPKNRLKFFTPIKNAFDFWMQFYSDLFQLNPETWELESRHPGKIPAVSLDDYYTDVAKTLAAFGDSAERSKNAGISDLDFLEIKGKVKLAGTTLRGRVVILNESETLGDLSGQVLEDATVKIDSKGRIVRQSNDRPGFSASE